MQRIELLGNITNVYILQTIYTCRLKNQIRKFAEPRHFYVLNYL